jgi:lipopolysaccharide biosynthesis glycosyltransferase
MKNAIVVCVTANWLAPAAVTLLSCAKHGAAEFADLLIVSPYVETEERNKLDAFNTAHNLHIKLINVELGDLGGMGLGRLGIGALLRLKLDQFLPPDYHRVLYLDSDVLAEASCKSLFNMNLESKAFAAVESIAMLPWINNSSTQHLSKIGMRPDNPYFNSGVMIFDWEKTLTVKLLPRSLELLKANRDWPFQDQDVLNAACVGQWKMLDHKWNVTKKTADYLKIRPRFRHFNGNAKPWNSKSRLGFATYHRFYAQSLTGTPWHSFLDQPQRPWPLKDNWRAVTRYLSIRKIAKLRHHTSLVADKL